MPAGQYFEADPAVRSRPDRIDLTLPDGTVSLAVDRGVFAGRRVDPGTLLFLRHVAPPPVSGHLLDLGCGYGPIACTLARRSPGATVWAVDVNARALGLTETNAAALHLGNIHAVRPDEVPAEVRFAGIWSNPPVRIGKAALHDLLERWLPSLAPDAGAWLVVHKHLGADSLADWISERWWPARRVASKQGYRILEIRRR